MAFKDHFSTQAGDYTRFRPVYPRSLFAFLAEKAPGHELAWDCGTGNGQAALDLIAFFDKVHATDASESQIQHAKRHARIVYAATPAERSGLEPGSVDLITAAQALHWFDFDRFYAEARRVAKPGAVIAAWCYELHVISPAVDRVIGAFYQDTVGVFWPPERELIEKGYKTIPFPFTRIEAPNFAMDAVWDLHAQLGYLRTWSAVQKYRAFHGQDPVSLIEKDLAKAWGGPGSTKKVVWPLQLLLGVAR